ncbi:hypothetical protein [Legionella santicrucis]|nr:hypothetical protein [Legionella santicrucis]
MERILNGSSHLLATFLLDPKECFYFYKLKEQYQSLHSTFAPDKANYL